MPLVQVHVDLGDFEDSDLLRELVDRKLLTEAEATALNKRAIGPRPSIKEILASPSDWDRAVEEMTTGRVEEALIYFERAIPAMRGCLDRLRGH